jgi:hypothetical protein
MHTEKPWHSNYVVIANLIMPILMVFCAYYTSTIQTNINETKTKVEQTYDLIFKHVTNDEMHSPRSVVVSKSEFMIYQEFRAQQMAELRQDMKEIKTLIEQTHEKVSHGKN